MSVAVPGHCLAPWLMVLGLGAGLLERAAFFSRVNFSSFTRIAVVSTSFHLWCTDSKHKDGKGKVESAGPANLACRCRLLHFMSSFLTPVLDYQKIQAQFRWQARTNCLNGNNYAAHDSTPPHYLQKGDALTLGGLGWGVVHQEQQQLRSTAWHTRELAACARPQGH